MSKHTEGPWKAIKTHLGSTFAPEIHTLDCREIATIECGNQKENIANARLIAAAPETKEQRDDLLGLIKKIKRHLDGGGSIQPENGVHVAVRAAIGKATGD